MCDIVGCKNKAVETVEDMEDGAWLDLCEKHLKVVENIRRIK